MPHADQIDSTSSPASVTTIRSAAYAFFAVTIIAVGIFGLARGVFPPIWTGVPLDFPARGALAQAFGIVCVAAGCGLFWRRTAGIASSVLLISFLIWMTLFRLPAVFRAPFTTDPWWATGDTAVMMAASWVLYVWSAGTGGRRRLGFAAGENGLRIARVIFGLGLLPFGVAHFTYFQHTVDMVPSWLPWHAAWASITGCGFLLAGVGLIVGVFARLAATLATLQLGLFTLLVWVPVMVARPSPGDWAEFVSSWVLTSAAWVVADSLRSMPPANRLPAPR